MSHPLIEQLRLIKEESGATNDELSRKIGVSSHTVTRWLTGDIGVPNVGTQKLIRLFIEEYKSVIGASRTDRAKYFMEA